MKIAIMGVGGLGGYLGGWLAHTGQDVTFLARGERLRVMREQGLHVRGMDKDFILENLPSQWQPSMLVDLEQGRRLEVEAWNGTISQMGKEMGIRTPANDFIYACLKPYMGGRL
jgi:ketopantoate reductase